MKSRTSYAQYPLKKGDLFDGIELLADDVFIVGNCPDRSVRKRLSLMTAMDKNDTLHICKEVRVLVVTEESKVDFENGFEYPVSSGNFFSVSQAKYPEFNALELNKDVLVYPFTYYGNGTSKVIFADSTELMTFKNAALFAQGTYYATKFVPTISAITSVVISGGDLIAAVDSVNNINYGTQS